MPPAAKAGIHFAEVKLGDLIMQNETRVLEFTDYGKRFIVKHKMSPDAFVQIAMMVAYYRMYVRSLLASAFSFFYLLTTTSLLISPPSRLYLLLPTKPNTRYGAFVNVYESVQTKFYLHGRTEAMRSVTPEVKTFGKVFRGKAPAPDKVAALRTAVAAHVGRCRLAAVGQGIDRHLYALAALWKEREEGAVAAAGGGGEGKEGAGEGGEAAEESKEGGGGGSRAAPRPLPGLFSCDAFRTMNNTLLSTSNCGNPALRLFGFGPVVREAAHHARLLTVLSLALLLTDDVSSTCFHSPSSTCCNRCATASASATSSRMRASSSAPRRSGGRRTGCC